MTVTPAPEDGDDGDVDVNVTNFIPNHTETAAARHGG